MILEEKKKELQREYLRSWRKKNREKVNAYAREWRRKNPDRDKEIRDRYWENKVREAEEQERKTD